MGPLKLLLDGLGGTARFPRDSPHGQFVEPAHDHHGAVGLVEGKHGLQEHPLALCGFHRGRRLYRAGFRACGLGFAPGAAGAATGAVPR